MPFIPHTHGDIEAMLKRIGIEDTQALFDEIPQEFLQESFQDIPEGMGEMALLTHAKALADKNQTGICFIGAGSYDHHIPAVVWDIASRGEFLTSYTPYQAEASQGTLQLLYEYQTMIAELTGMEVANASLYDGASALAEAVLMAVRVNRQSKSNRVLVAGTLNPFYRETLETIVRNQHIEVITLPFDGQQGITALSSLAAYEKEDIAAIVIQQPNFFGCLESVDALTDWGHAHQAIVIASVNPISLGVFNPPGLWGSEGVDIVCGEGQPLGVPMASGGPYFGFLSATLAHVRQMPGRIIGQTVDKDGNRGFSLTLQAREQHIRRGKATSNICTNQGLLVTAATIHMSLLGATGLVEVATACHHNTHALVDALTAIPRVSLAFSSHYFHEAVITLPKPVMPVLKALADKGIAGGYDLSAQYPNLGNALLICATEMRTEEDIALYADCLKHCLS